MGPGNPTSDGGFGEGLSVEGQGMGKYLGTLAETTERPPGRMGVLERQDPDTSLQRHWILSPQGRTYGSI